MWRLLAVLLGAACGDRPSGPCTDGETRSCYRGLIGTENVGVCKPGTETCSDGRWQGACVGDVTPFIEICNDVDDDCNGIVDDAEGTGEPCTGTNDCPGMRVCRNGELACSAPGKNECGLCGGPAVSDLGDGCSDGVCDGTLVCTVDDTAAVCYAPPLNECDLCGGPPVPDLGTLCMAGSGCAGRLACNMAGTGSVCDCAANICNDNGTIRDVVSPGVGDLVITEMMPSPSQVSDAVGEWFEVYVTRDVDLNNLGLDRAGDSSNPNVIRAYDCMRVTAGSYLVFAKATTNNGGLPPVTATFTFSLVPSAGDIRLLADATVIDAVTWTSSRSGKALQLDRDVIDAVANDQESNFCDAWQTYGLGDFGTPGAVNSQCVPAGQCDAGGTVRAIVPPMPGQLVITEIMPNPAVEPAQEWFEITNIGGAPFDLNGLGLDRASDSSAPDVIDSPTCKSLAPGDFALFAHSSDPLTNGGLTTVDATFGMTLLNGSGGDVQVVDPVTMSVYDSVPWSGSTDGVSAQLIPGMFTTTANDSEANFCAATTPYGSGANLGTPRAANGCP